MASVELVVVPRAAEDRVGPYADGVLRVRVVRPPVDGAANESVLRLVAEAIGVPPSRLSLVTGARGRRKRVSVDGLDDAELARRLLRLAAD